MSSPPPPRRQPLRRQRRPPPTTTTMDASGSGLAASGLGTAAGWNARTRSGKRRCGAALSQTLASASHSTPPRPHPPSPSPSASAEGYPTMAQVRIVSSLDDVAAALQDLQITEMNQAGLVRFQLDEQAPLREAAKINVKTRPGRHGFILVNPELMDCKFYAQVALETSFNTMLDASIERIDQELLGVEASIAQLRVLVLYNDNQMPHNGPPLLERNQGVQHVIYPHPPFPRDPSFEYGTDQQRGPYQPPYGTQQERDEAAARDRRAQRALWHAKLRILEARQSILKEMRYEMMSKMRTQFKRIMEERSDLGAGYAEYEFPPLA